VQAQKSSQEPLEETGSGEGDKAGDTSDHDQPVFLPSEVSLSCWKYQSLDVE